MPANVEPAMRARTTAFDAQAVRSFIQAHYLKNRTIVTADIASILDGVEQLSGLPVIRHRFRTGEDHGTWQVPPQWDVRDAWLKDASGTVLASTRDHPLFVGVYSKPGRYRVSKAELLKRVYTDPAYPEAFAYNWRFAYDPAAMLKDWCISLPKPVVDRLGEGPFEVCIEADVKDGEMLVGEIILPGQTTDTISWLADYCHPGQANDSLSGLAMFAEVMRALAARPSRRYTYNLLMFPETIGSAIYLAADPSRFAVTRGAVFSEAIGWGEAWYLKATRQSDTYLDLLALECQRAFSTLRRAAFFDLAGNDELIFDSVQAGIPSLSLQKYPFAGYHTSEDKPSRLQDADLQRAFDIILHLVTVAEQDRVYQFTHPVPFHMSRYGLFADTHYQPADFFRNREIVYNLLDGRRSLLAIAQQLQCPFADVAGYARRMAGHGLVRDTGASPWDQALEEPVKRALRMYAP